MLRVTSAILLVFAVTACATPEYVPTSKSLTLRELVETDWKVSWPTKTRSIGINSPKMLRISTYSNPPFIHRQFLERLSEPKKELEALCSRQQGKFEYLGVPDPKTATKHIANPSYQAQIEQIINAAPAGAAGMNSVISQMERANTSEVFRQLLSAARSAPDALTKDALDFANNQRWLGSFACSGGNENWVGSIYFGDWQPVNKDGMAYRRITVTSHLSLL